jgi:hypothetical protein
MKNQIKVLLGFLLVFCAGGDLFAGDAPVYDLSGITPIWDISGTYVDDLDGISMDITLVQDGKGKIGGGGSWSMSEDGLSISANMTVKGSLKQSKGLTTVAFTIQHKGTVADGINALKFSASQQVNAEIDAELLQMTGTLRTSMSMGGRKFSATEYWEDDLPIGMNGSCTLVLNPVIGAKGVSGSAQLNLSNLETVNFDIKGSDKKGVVKLSLKGSKSTDDSGASLSVEIDALSGMIRALKGKVVGQSMGGGSVEPENPFTWGALTGPGDGDVPSTRI